MAGSFIRWWEFYAGDWIYREGLNGSIAFRNLETLKVT